MPPLPIMAARSRIERPRRLLVEWLVVGVVLSVLVITLVLTGALARVDNLIYDATIKARPGVPLDSVIIIGIDEASLARIGPWPWPRQVHADAIDTITRAGASRILYDVLFVEPAAGDAALDAALARSAPIALPMQFRVPGTNGRSHDLLLPTVGARSLAPAGAVRIGHSSVIPDSDGVVRRINLAFDAEQRWPHIAAQVAGLPPLPPFVARGATLPIKRQGERLIGYRGGAGQFRSVSFAALLAGEVPRAALAGRTVLVGATAPGLGDLFSAPGAGASGVMTGVEIQANVVADLIEGRPLRAAPPFASVLLALAVLWLAMIGLLRFRPTAAVAFGTVLLLVVVLGAATVFARFGLWIAPAAAATGLLLAQPAWAWRRLAVVNRWMMDELAELGQPGGGSSDEAAPADPVTRTTQLLEAAIDRVDSLRELADAAIRGLPDATILVDRSGAIVGTNTAAEALFGAAPTLASIEAAFEPDGGTSLGAATFADPASPWLGEHRARNSSIRDIRFTPWRDSAGLALGWIVRFADISALRRAEQAREEALQLLTHDMRAPQASILALVQSESGLDPALAERLRHLAQRTIALADGYLQLARAEAGSYVLEEVDLAAIATEAIDELWPQSRARGVRIDGQGVDGEALMTGNYQLLLRALVNLIGNAVKFSPRQSTVIVGLHAEAGDWRIDVIDKGPGISPAVQARLFGRFRTGTSPDPSGGGVGLGLAFVRSVAAGHGGSVTCTSVEGEGATFTLRLPKAGV